MDYLIGNTKELLEMDESDKDKEYEYLKVIWVVCGFQVKEKANDYVEVIPFEDENLFPLELKKSEFIKLTKEIDLESKKAKQFYDKMLTHRVTSKLAAQRRENPYDLIHGFVPAEYLTKEQDVTV